MYYFPTPSYILMVFGLFAGITSGLAFEATLKQRVQMSMSTSNQTKRKIPRWELFVPFLGICTGICVFLASGLGIFNIVNKIAYAISLPVTILMASLIWSQLSKLLLRFEQGNLKEADFDTLE
ncbi:MAG: hypothetical protein QNJ54_03360 [Prochloraceae cyanobacterium]|nr:hypothetical protein [Prochloraceae cyanobacterium]